MCERKAERKGGGAEKIESWKPTPRVHQLTGNVLYEWLKGSSPHLEGSADLKWVTKQSKPLQKQCF